MEVTTLAGALLRKVGAAKLKADEAKTQLAKLREKSASWVSAYADLQAVKVELENTRSQVVSLEFQLAGEQKRLDETRKACAVAVERHEEAMINNEELVRQKDEAVVKISDLQKELEGERTKTLEERESLQKELEAERAKATAERETLKKELEAKKAKAASETATLRKELEEERAKAASERAAYPNLYVAAVDQFKGSTEFQMAVDAAVASSLAREESGGGGPIKDDRWGQN
ncbi:uncharacterized protein LOC114314376 [Camellia sinensis]|uniref:uncharacterized protein LOC114314376 n=1 Tax=Camellia sinensis TaxID=4442 RepID=UPI0010360F5E|nr:uncharacterized protein LOC114314376 [Camellia sinensis]